MINHFHVGLLGLFLWNQSLDSVESYKDNLLARGEHRIEVQNYGHKRPEVPIDIMQSNYYNAHHEDYVIRIEDLNKTLNREINEDVSREYSEWFNAEFNRRLSEYPYDYRAEEYQDQQTTPTNENP